MAAGDDERTGKARKRVGDASTGQRPGDRDVGHALRSVYVETVNEEVPEDLLSLLGKLD